MQQQTIRTGWYNTIYWDRNKKWELTEKFQIASKEYEYNEQA